MMMASSRPEPADEPSSSKVSLTGAKRGTQAADEADPGAKTQRFLWSDGLHKDFIAAIFDVGMRHAEPSAILECIARDEPLSSGAISLTNVQAQIAHLQLLRDRSRREISSFYERSLVAEEPLGLAPSTVPPTNAENDKLAKTQRLYALRKQLEVVSSTVDVQSRFLEQVKRSIEKQLLRQSAIIRIISQMDPSHVASLIPPSTDRAGHTTRLESSGSIQSAQSELDSTSEMRTLMGLHRELLISKEDQLSQFSSELPTGETNDWTRIWEDDRLEEHLLSFRPTVSSSSSS